jgi:hypothetical protein
MILREPEDPAIPVHSVPPLTSAPRRIRSRGRDTRG